VLERLDNDVSIRCLLSTNHVTIVRSQAECLSVVDSIGRRRRAFPYLQTLEFDLIPPFLPTMAPFDAAAPFGCTPPQLGIGDAALVFEHL